MVGRRGSISAVETTQAPAWWSRLGVDGGGVRSRRAEVLGLGVGGSSRRGELRGVRRRRAAVEVTRPDGGMAGTPVLVAVEKVVRVTLQPAS